MDGTAVGVGNEEDVVRSKFPLQYRTCRQRRRSSPPTVGRMFRWALDHERKALRMASAWSGEMGSGRINSAESCAAAPPGLRDLLDEKGLRSWPLPAANYMFVIWAAWRTSPGRGHVDGVAGVPVVVLVLPSTSGRARVGRFVEGVDAGERQNRSHGRTGAGCWGRWGRVWPRCRRRGCMRPSGLGYGG